MFEKHSFKNTEALLVNELQVSTFNSFIQLRIWRDKFRTTFNETKDEESRVALLKAHAEMYDIAESYFDDRSIDIEFLRQIRKSEWKAICYLEAQLCCASSYLILGELQRICHREFVAGRMEEKAFGSYADQFRDRDDLAKRSNSKPGLT